MRLLERDDQLRLLLEQFQAVGPAGRLVLLSGEPGAGKSALVAEFRRRHLDGCRVLLGRCDDLFAPRPLGPIADIARQEGGRLAAALASGKPAEAFDAFLLELSSPSGTTVVILEDLQWADEATLDLLRFVTRRLDTLGCLVLATHRSDLAADHPFRQAAASLVGPLVTRVRLPPLSVDAVRELVGEQAVDPERLHARTGGNPFFVVELLSGDATDALPETVRDSVLGRAARLEGAARDALDAAAVLGYRCDPELIRVVGDCDAAAIDQCVEVGMLVDEAGHVAFRHELARQAIDEALTPLRRRQLHARALEALDALDAGSDDEIVQRAHHAIGAGDRAAIVDRAARAGARCVALGAFREAAALYGSALEHAVDAGETTRRHLLEWRARTCERIEHFDAAILAGEELLRLPSDERTRATWECWIGGVYRCAGRPDDAWRALEAAVGRLEVLGESAELARAIGLLAQHQMVTGRSADAVGNARRAQAMAERFGDEEVAIHALDSCGTALACLGDDTGFDLLAEAIARAKRAGVHHEVSRASGNLAESLLATRGPVAALPHLDEGIDVGTAHELRFSRNSLLSVRAQALLLAGRWDDAIADVQALLAEPYLSDVNRSGALSRLGRVRARRGDPGAVEALEDALRLALPYDELQTILPVRIALAEASWLAGAPDRAATEVRAVVPLAQACPEPWRAGELALWARRTGVEWEPPIAVAEPFAAMLAGDARGAAAVWRERGCPYEAADALADSDEVDDLRAAFDELLALDARPRAQLVTRRLRRLGVRDLPRGPRSGTLANPARLTARELEVASLLAAGLANNEIAERLVVSPKTVDHHVSSVLAKLAVPSRRQVADAAARLGVDLPSIAGS